MRKLLAKEKKGYLFGGRGEKGKVLSCRLPLIPLGMGENGEGPLWQITSLILTRTFQTG